MVPNRADGAAGTQAHLADGVSKLEGSGESMIQQMFAIWFGSLVDYVSVNSIQAAPGPQLASA
jgi:hypothetical protein